MQGTKNRRLFRGIKLHQRRVILVLISAFSLLVLPTIILLSIAGFQALSIKKDMSDLLAISSHLSTSISEKNIKALEDELQEASRITAAAQKTTNQFPWQFSEAIPFVGENFTAISTVLDTSATLINKVALPGLPLIDQTITGNGLIVDGGINTGFLNEAWVLIAATKEKLIACDTSLSSIDQSRLLPEVRSGIQKLSPLVHGLTTSAVTADTYKETINSLVGAGGSRNYLVVFQNPAEMRPLGGLPGSIALMRIDSGSFTIDRQTSASMSIYPFQDSSEFEPKSQTVSELFYEDANRQMAQAMNTPSFSEAAQRVVGHWSRAFPEQISGVISVDPIALGYVLSAMGPIQLDSGTVLDQNNLSQYLLHDVYVLTDSNNEQDLLYAEVVEKFVDKFKQGPIDPLKLIEAFQKSTAESRLLFWGTNNSENSLAQLLHMSVEPPLSTQTTSGLGVYFEFAQGSKMYYFLNQSVSISSKYCSKEKLQKVEVEYELTNSVRPEDADSLAPSIWAVSHVEPKGAILSRVLVYTQPGATIESVTHTNEFDAVREYIDGDNPVSFVESLLVPSSSTKVKVTYTFPAEAQKIISPYVTPLSQPTATTIKYEQNCSK